MPRWHKPPPSFRIFQPISGGFPMPIIRGSIYRIIPFVVLIFATLSAPAQSGNAGTVRGTVTDPSGAVIPNATVHLSNQVSGFDRTAAANSLGEFEFSNVPFNTYRIRIFADGFAPLSQTLGIQSVVGTSLKLVLQIVGASQTVTVESTGDLVETDSTFHTDVDRDMFIKVPMESQSEEHTSEEHTSELQSL